jgi:type VI secretion system protein ImpK
MSQDDVFSMFDDEKTRVVRPSPGGAGRPAPAPAPPPPVFASPANLGLDRLFGDNPLVAAALPLLALVPSLRASVQHADVAGLRQRLVGEIETFENKLPRLGVTQENLAMASYALCSLLDETIQNTPWGLQSDWAKNNLALRFRRQALGGEGFFEIVNRLSRQPAQNLPLIELCYLCLSLGLQGRYGNKVDGRNELEKYRTELYLLIQRVRGDFERGLSPRWQGLQDLRNPVLRAVPWWVAAAVALAVLIAAYAGFLFSIDHQSEPARIELAKLAAEKITLAGPVPAPVAKPPVPRLQERFAWLPQDVEVIEGRILRIRNSFEKGSDQVKPAFLPVLQKIAAELASGQDTVWITGHTDSTPIQTLKFPSNWALSVARARQVSDILLGSGVAPGKVEKVEGKADNDPLPQAPNDTPEHHALNRRVDIIIR